MRKTLIAMALIAASSCYAGSRAYELSTRGNVGTGDDVMIGGLIVGRAPEDRPCEDGGANGQGPIMFAIRALGPSLTAASVPGAILDPALQFYDADGVLLFSQDSFLEATAGQLAILASYGLIPSDAAECATVVELLPGRYTAIVCGEGDAPTGVALLEIYKLAR
jgi:hypothetical protein